MKLELLDIINYLTKEQEKKSIDINTGFFLFYDYIKNFRREETCKFHLTYFRHFKLFCDKNNISNTKDINNEQIIKYINYCKIDNNKNITINKKITSIKYWLKWLSKNNIIEMPKITIDKLENDSARINVMSNNDLKILLEHKDSLNINQKLSILLMLKTGIRRNELCNIELSNIDYANKSIYLSYTKTNNNRYIFLDDELIELIKIKSKNNLVYLFEDKKHKPLNKDIINNYTKQTANKLNIKITPHMLRHTFATKLFNNNIDLESIRLLLGHSDYTMLKRYIHIKNKKLAEISTSLKY